MKENTAEVDNLFIQLKDATDKDTILDIENSILQLWQKTDDPFLNDIIALGVEQMSNERYKDAIATFSHALIFNQKCAEIFNKRAISYYMRGEFNNAIKDLKKVLELEPRHFAAMSGLSTIYKELKLEKHTLAMLHRLLLIVPNKEGLTSQARSLRKKIKSN
ncbi:tetratricopeptide repeat protein [Flammeovirga kamogawensis]|uniref:Tetratricopeptide repeat protein n=1 Tax=Flammeovirga kamogawensis TaxID=373891 RepID=A0ABX8GTN9_9BACT|nr:tetratricopeptide repeat protein [Flammeovirga kamogawensis]MBB6459992.1 Tfp pilus assembly protein PilF [Flammeovirga kamogawensis]QWG06960.1 tetratricopeptide repeat protein [Flammeovirga kamogawensis]TRX68780.1 tetratricopeptide repeat protein [Flammeovirga kamogawensis]